MSMIQCGFCVVTPTLSLLATLQYTANAYATTANITVPATAKTSDLAILIDRATSNDGSIPTDVTPTNWTQIRTEATNQTARQSISSRILAANESGNAITGMNGTGSNQKIMVILRGYDGGAAEIAISSISISDSAGQAVSTDPTAQNKVVSSYGANSQLFATYGSSGNVTTRQFDQGGVNASDYEFNTNTVLYAKIKQLAGGGNITVDMGDYGLQNILQSFVVTAS